MTLKTKITINKIGTLISGAIALFLIAQQFYYYIGFRMHMGGSIGIIGGADGPTSVFTTLSSCGTRRMLSLIGLFLVFTFYCGTEWRRFKKLQNNEQ